MTRVQASAQTTARCSKPRSGWRRTLRLWWSTGAAIWRDRHARAARAFGDARAAAVACLGGLPPSADRREENARPGASARARGALSCVQRRDDGARPALPRARALHRTPRAASSRAVGDVGRGSRARLQQGLAVPRLAGRRRSHARTSEASRVLAARHRARASALEARAVADALSCSHDARHTPGGLGPSWACPGAGKERRVDRPDTVPESRFTNDHQDQ